MKALILTSGLGSRLYPITRITPKPLLDVKGKPILAHLLDSLDSSNYIKNISIIYPHNFENQFHEFSNYFRYNKNVELISDKHRIVNEMPGSIGAIAYFIKSKNVDDDLLVVAGDNLFDFTMDDFINFYHKNKKTSIAVYDFNDKNKVANRFGVVELKEDKIISFEEKPSNPKTSLVATLCYLISKHDFHHLGKETFKENAGDLIKHLIHHGDVYGFEFKGKWFDIGTHEDLEKARKEF